jgi:hypothetical protein
MERARPTASRLFSSLLWPREMPLTKPRLSSRDEGVEFELNEIEGGVHGLDLPAAKSNASKEAMRRRIPFLRRVFAQGRRTEAGCVAGVAGSHALHFVSGLVSGTPRPSGWGFSLGVVYLVWALVVAALVPLSRWFAGVKQRRRDWWLSYL